MVIFGIQPFLLFHTTGKLFHNVKKADHDLQGLLSVVLQRVNERDIRVSYRLDLGAQIRAEADTG